MINEKTQKIFWFLWRNRNEPYTIREIARQTTVSYGSTWSILKEFEDIGLVYGIEKRKAHLYVLNFENSLCFHVWSLLNDLKRQALEIDPVVKDETEKIEKGFVVQYFKNGGSETLFCSEKLLEGVHSIDFETFRRMCTGKKEFYSLLWDTGVVLKGEKAFYDFMWDMAEKKVIGVSI